MDYLKYQTICIQSLNFNTNFCDKQPCFKQIVDFVTKQGLTNPKKLRIIKVSPIFSEWNRKEGAPI